MVGRGPLFYRARQWHAATASSTHSLVMCRSSLSWSSSSTLWRPYRKALNTDAALGRRRSGDGARSVDGGQRSNRHQRDTVQCNA